MSVFKRRSREQRVVRARAKLAACGFPARILMYPTPSQIFEQKRLLAVCTRPSMACKLRKTQPVKQFLFRYRRVLLKCISLVINELAIGRQRKEDEKPCPTRVKIISCKKIPPKPHLSLNRSFCKRQEHGNFK